MRKCLLILPIRSIEAVVFTRNLKRELNLPKELLRLKETYINRKRAYQDLTNGALLQSRVCGESGRR